MTNFEHSDFSKQSLCLVDVNAFGCMMGEDEKVECLCLSLSPCTCWYFKREDGRECVSVCLSLCLWRS